MLLDANGKSKGFGNVVKLPHVEQTADPNDAALRQQLVESGVLCPFGGIPHEWRLGYREITDERTNLHVFYCVRCRRLDVTPVEHGAMWGKHANNVIVP